MELYVFVVGHKGCITEENCQSNTEKVTENQKTVEKTVEKMLKLMAENPFITTFQLSESIGVSTSV